jgi:hypothetical protein
MFDRYNTVDTEDASQAIDQFWGYLFEKRVTSPDQSSA